MDLVLERDRQVVFGIERDCSHRHIVVLDIDNFAIALLGKAGSALNLRVNGDLVGKRVTIQDINRRKIDIEVNFDALHLSHLDAGYGHHGTVNQAMCCRMDNHVPFSGFGILFSTENNGVVDIDRYRGGTTLGHNFMRV